jgi:glucose-1-phosphate adenylyltransferase
MLLAGGQGMRLGAITQRHAKPAIPIGGNNIIIDFVMSNFINSGFDTIGVLTQYEPHKLNSDIGDGSSWGFSKIGGGVYILPPFTTSRKGEWYRGTANAIYQNLSFIEKFSPEHVIVLSGDHVYKMDYAKMFAYHKKTGADATIAVIEVPKEEVSRFGIVRVNSGGFIVDFQEKPKETDSRLASMGIYIFRREVLERVLKEDEADKKSSNDFGKDIIPKMIASGAKIAAHRFSGYWKDVGTIESFWQSNMDLLGNKGGIDMTDKNWPIYSRVSHKAPHYISENGSAKNALLGKGCVISGEVLRSVIFEGVTIEKGACVIDSVIFPGCKIGENAHINKAILASGVKILPGAMVGTKFFGANDEYVDETICKDITVVGEKITIGENVKVRTSSMVGADILTNKYEGRNNRASAS